MQELVNSVEENRASLCAHKSQLETELHLLNQKSGDTEETVNNQLTQLEQKKSQLENRKKLLADNLALVEADLDKTAEAVARLGTNANEQLSVAANQQRWFFFKNKPHILFDRKTGLLWPNLDYFAYEKEENSPYEYEEVVNIVQHLVIDGQENWRLPTLRDAKFAFEGKNFPFQDVNSCYRIKGCDACYIQAINAGDTAMWLDTDFPRTGYTDAIFMPCTSVLVTPDYAHDVADTNKVFTPQERAMKTLAVFCSNGLEPLFDDPQMTTLYRELYIERPALLQALADVDAKLAVFQEENGGRALRSALFDHRTLLAEYDIAAIDNSIIQYYAAVEKWITQIFTMIESYEQGNADFFASAHELNALLRRKRKLSALLTEDEQMLLFGRRKRLEDACAANFDGLKDKLMTVKTQVECFDQRLKAINEGENSIRELACLDNEPRVAFPLFAENTAQLVKQDLLRLEYIETNLAALQQLADVEDQWTSEYELFVSKGCSDFLAACEEEGIQAEQVQLWMSDWRKLRLLLERKVALLIDLTLCQQLPMEITAALLETLTAFRKKINEFYVFERKGIHQKYAFAPGGDAQEKFEQEHELFKLMIVLQEQIQQAIFSCDHSLTRVTILNWASELFSLPVEDVLAFVEDRHFDVIAKEILDDFTKLRESNYKTFLNDAAAYAAERKEREKQYTALMFKMRNCLKQ